LNFFNGSGLNDSLRHQVKMTRVARVRVAVNQASFEAFFGQNTMESVEHEKISVITHIKGRNAADLPLPLRNPSKTMKWTQLTDPFHNIALSALVAAVPVLFIFFRLIKKTKGYWASLLTMLLAIVMAILVYGMPVKLSGLSALHGALYGLFPIGWVIIGAVFLFNVTVKSGQFEVIKNFMASITPDRRLQALLIAFSFSSEFLQLNFHFHPPLHHPQFHQRFQSRNHHFQGFHLWSSQAQ
jgi:hypothetical protein